MILAQQLELLNPADGHLASSGESFSPCKASTLWLSTLSSCRPRTTPTVRYLPERSYPYLDLIVLRSAEISAIAAADCAYDFLCLYALGTDARLVQAEEESETRSHSEL